MDDTLCKWRKKEISKKDYSQWLNSEKEKELAKENPNPEILSKLDKLSFELEHGKTIYISGPITTNKEHYHECFEAAKEFLLSKGYDVLDPSTDDFTEEVKKKGVQDIWSPEAWLYYMQRDMFIVAQCDGIYMMENWEKSKGAIIEKIVAERFNLPVYYEKEKEKVPVLQKL